MKQLHYKKQKFQQDAVVAVCDVFEENRKLAKIQLEKMLRLKN